MNIIDERYKYALAALQVLKDIEKKNGKPPLSVIETFHYITPRSDYGLVLTHLIGKFNAMMAGKGALVINEFAVDISIDEIEARINQSMTISKKNIQHMIVKYDLTDKFADNKDNDELIKKLFSDSLPT